MTLIRLDPGPSRACCTWPCWGLAEADGNRTRQRLNQPLTGFEDRGTHQASGRLLDEDQEVRQA